MPATPANDAQGEHAGSPPVAGPGTARGFWERFPLVRTLSGPVTAWLIRTPLSANQVTWASLAAGLGAAALLALGHPGADVAAALLLVACYVLDNSDGDVARAKDQCSEFGRRLDSFVDWVVHTAFFAGLGVGVSHARGSEIWLWLGLAAAAGGTVNYLVGHLLEWQDRRRGAGPADESPEDAPRPRGAAEWALFVFRELFRADFCFIVLALALVGGLWLLLPAGALGAQVYWVSQFSRAARRFHV